MIALRRHLRRPIVGSLVVLLALATTACHTYTPVETPAPGTTVRVRVPVVSAAASRNAPPRTEAFEGLVVAAGDTIVLATRQRQEYGAYREVVIFDTLRLAQDQLYGVEVREFSPKKSIGLGLGLTALVVGVAVAAFGGDPGSDEGIPPDPPPPPPFTIVTSISSVVGLLFGR